MGEYFIPVNHAKRQWVNPLGGVAFFLKLPEQAWQGNRFMDAMGALLGPGGPWEGDPLSWPGDYSDPDLYDGVRGPGWLHITLREPGRRYRYALDHDRREFVAAGKERHPLPYLLAPGDGEWFGRWTGDRVSLADKPPAGYAEVRNPYGD